MSDAPRGRETSTALTEIRTVLARAIHAREVLDQPTEWHLTEAGRIDFDRPKYDDPDAVEMRAALDDVIARLSRWRRTGRPTKTP